MPLPGQAGGVGKLTAVQHLVVHAGHPEAAHGDVAAAPCGARGGHVESACRRCAPVDQQRLALARLIPQADPPDVPALPGPQVQAAEAQPVLRRVKPGQLLAMPEDRGIPVEPGLRRAAVLPQSQREPGRRPVPQHVDALVQPSDVLLLTADLTHRHLHPFTEEPHRKIAG